VQHSLSFSTLLLSTDSFLFWFLGAGNCWICLWGFFQEKLFKVAGLPMVENCMAGYNSCMFAYGQVGTNKKENCGF
jgi:hypothetical protein